MSCGGCNNEATNGKKAPPGASERLRNLAKTAVAFAKSGFALTEADLRRERNKVCAGLDGHLRCGAFDDNWCGECGCYLPLAQIVAAKECPRDMWPKITPLEAPDAET